MEANKRLRNLLFGAVLLEVGVLGAVGLGLAASTLMQGGDTTLLLAMRSARVLTPALALLLGGAAGLAICVREYLEGKK